MLVFTIVAIPLMMMTIDSTIVATTLHTLQRDLDTSVNWVGWTITAYSLGFIVMLPVTGVLSTRYGQRRVFLGSVLTFTAASLACGLAGDITTLIVLRVLQAAGGAGFTPSATGIIVDHFGDARDRAVSLFGSIFPVGALIGPVLGGLFVTYWSWRGIFLVNVPFGLLVLALAIRFVPRDAARRPEATTKAFDVAGMLLLTVGILGGMFAASYLGEHGASALSPLFLVPGALSLAGLAAFFGHIRRTPAPFIPPRLIHGPGFGAVNLVNVLIGGVSQGVVVLVPLYAANRYGIPALDAALLLVAQAIAAVIFSVTVTFALRRTGYRMPLYLGTGAIVVGTALLALAPPAGWAPFWWLSGAAFLIGVGGGAISPPCRNAGLQLAPEQSATLAALRSMSLQTGAIMTVSVATAVIAAATHPGSAQAWTYAALALVLASASTLIRRIPEYRGAW